MNYSNINIWYATDTRHNSPTRFINFDTSGTLEIIPDGLRFHNARGMNLVMKQVQQVTLARQKMPWVSMLLTTILAFIVIGSMQLGSGVPVLYIAQFCIIGFIIVFGLGLLVSYILKWVMVEYLDEYDRPQRAYFAENTFLGWGGVLGGTNLLYQMLNSQLKTDN